MWGVYTPFSFIITEAGQDNILVFITQYYCQKVHKRTYTIQSIFREVSGNPTPVPHRFPEPEREILRTDFRWTFGGERTFYDHPSLGMDQEILPCRLMSIDSDKFNPSLLMMKDKISLIP